MTICPWCGQQSQSDAVCDWCRRPIERKAGPPPGTRNDLDFLKEEAEGDRHMILRWGAFAVAAVVCGIVLFLLFRGNSQEPVVAEADQAGGPPTPQRNSPPASATLISAPAYQEHRPDWWISQWNSGADLISNARSNPLRSAVPTQPVGVAGTAVGLVSPVQLRNVVFSMVALPGGAKRAVGRADIYNTSDRNVLDFRADLVWGAKDYQMVALQGTNKGLHQVYQRSLRPGEKMAVQFVSLKITDHPDGTPNVIRLMSWLDGSPGLSDDEYPLQLGR